MMEWIKKYWWVILIILALPVIINFILLMPALSPIVGEDTDWLSFWGGYLGAIISAVAAFIILHIQRKDNESQNEKNRVKNEKENENNRNLQLNILKYQQEMQWLNAFREASINYVSSYCYNDIVHIVNTLRKNPETAFNMIAPLLDRLAKHDMNLKYIGIREQGKAQLEVLCDSTFILYNEVLDDIQQVFVYIINNQNPTFEAFCIKSTKMNISDTMKSMIQQVAIRKNVSVAQRFNDLAMMRVKIIEKRAEDIGNHFMSYITKQQERIDKILTENID